MRIKLRKIGNSRGLILPGTVADQLSRRYLHEELLGPEGDTEPPNNEPAENRGTSRYDFDEEYLELTVIGETAVLTAIAADELELQAALAYAIVKRRRQRLLEDLATNDTAFIGGEKRLLFRRPGNDAAKGQ